MQELVKKKFLRFLIILVFGAIIVFAPLLIVGMGQHEMGDTSNCPFMIGEMALCQMNALDHLASWRAVFVVLPVEFSSFVLLLLILGWSWAKLRNLFAPPNTPQQKPSFLYPNNNHPLSFATLLLGSVISPRAP